VTYREITDRIVASGGIPLADMEVLREWRRTALQEGSEDSFDWELSTGRTITVMQVPMDDGWLTTYLESLGFAPEFSLKQRVGSPAFYWYLLVWRGIS
jgi:hypothetical protein